VRQAGFEDSLAEVRVLPTVGDAPLQQDPTETRVCIGIDHNDRSSAEVKLFHGAQPDALKTAYDDVVVQLQARLGRHPVMLPTR
jgi:hypothetical protein